MVPSRSLARPVLEAILRRPATFGAGRLLAIDGPSGAGKTTLADAVASLTPQSTVVHTDDLLDGWGGLPGLRALLDGLLEPLAAGRPGRYRRYDWHLGRYTDLIEVPPLADDGLLILEGVGAGGRSTVVTPTLLLWLEVDAATRVARTTVRDGEAMQQHLARWRDDEQRLFAAEATRDRADLVVTDAEVSTAAGDSASADR